MHSGLVEGKHFYEVVLTELRKACEGAANVADAREGCAVNKHVSAGGAARSRLRRRASHELAVQSCSVLFLSCRERRQLQRRLAETTSPPPPPYSAAAPSAAAPSAAASCAAASAADGALNALEQARSAWFQRATNACNSGGHAAPAAAPYELPCATAFPAPASTPVTPVAVPIPCRPAPAQQPATPPAIATAAATPPPISMIGCYNCRKQFGAQCLDRSRAEHLVPLLTTQCKELEMALLRTPIVYVCRRTTKHLDRRVPFLRHTQPSAHMIR